MACQFARHCVFHSNQCRQHVPLIARHRPPALNLGTSQQGLFLPDHSDGNLTINISVPPSLALNVSPNFAADTHKNKFHGCPRQLNFGVAYTSGNAEHGSGAEFRLSEVTANCFLRVRTKVRPFVEENFKTDRSGARIRS
jgi:hypothetical protein